MTAAPHVLLVLASDGWGGTEKAFAELANALATCGRVTVAIPPGAELQKRLTPAVEVRHLRPGSRRHPAVVRHLARLITEVGADVVHSHAARATEMVYWASHFAGFVHVATKHNTRKRWIFGRVPCVTAVSEAAARSVEHERPVAVVYNGVDLAPVERAPESDLFTVFAVGRLHTHKGFDALIEAMAGLDFPWRLRIAGEGAERAALEGLIERHGAQESVDLLGHREDVLELAAAAHVQVVSSRTEGFSLALIEGLHACGVVLSTPVGIAPEILPDELLTGLEGIGSRLADVHARYDHFAGVTDAVRARVGDHFDLATSVNHYREVYRLALGR